MSENLIWGDVPKTTEEKFLATLPHPRQDYLAKIIDARHAHVESIGGVECLVVHAVDDRGCPYVYDRAEGVLRRLKVLRRLNVLPAPRTSTDESLAAGPDEILALALDEMAVKAALVASPGHAGDDANDQPTDADEVGARLLLAEISKRPDAEDLLKKMIWDEALRRITDEIWPPHYG